ncbi:MAG TPA: hypothetical protein VLX91_04585 [Candidatus Acidoferrales bacterium]|nr:hypothetical protein [Candidatus Acidoferrales bacterium]
MRNFKTILVTLWLSAAILNGCAPDAPRDNPLDPGSPNHTTDGNLSGKVLILNSLSVGISGALVTIEGTNLAQVTAADGSFSFPNAPSGSISVVITKSSYLNDTLRIAMLVGGTLDTLVHLDALPQANNAVVITNKTDHWYPGPVYTASVSASVTDPDGPLDVDTVYVKIDSLTFGMNYNAALNVYQVTINADSLPNNDLQWLIGKQFEVVAIDRENGIGLSPGFYVTRIIESEPLPTSPFQDTTTNYPVFSWGRVIVSFEYTYQLQVVSLAGGTIWSKSEINPGTNPDTINYSYPSSLPGLPHGNYYWTVAVVDQFGNSACSHEAAFFVPSQ